jgi:hypothetical protein
VDPRSILRYWLEAVRYEEALLSRPRVRGAPRDGAQSYFRLGPEHAELFLLARSSVSVALDEGALRFLQHTLQKKYGSEHWLAGWPVLYFSKKQELAPLFRFPIALAWCGKPASPTAIQLEPDGATLSLDTNLAHRELGILEEDLAELTARWERREPPATYMARDVLRLLDPQAVVGSLEGQALFTAVAPAAAARASRRVQVHAVGIVQDASSLAPTHHLQRELSALIADELALRRNSALSAYLGGARASSGWEPMMGRRRARGLTESQRAAGETFLDSTLTAVRGPPGTGKTQLILDLVAHALVSRIDRFERTGMMGEELFVVASTNNRAVDNVIDPLAKERLPLGLRAGNREVTGSITVEIVRNARAWLGAQSGWRLDDALALFRKARARWERAVGPERERRWKRSRHAEVLAELRSFEALPPLTPSERTLEAKCESFLAVLADLKALVIEERSLADRGSRGGERWVAERWAREGEGLLALLRELEPALSIELPPRPATLEAWFDRNDDAEEEVTRVLSSLRRRAQATPSRRHELEAELLALEAKDPAIAPAELEASAHGLYLAALAVREAWAVAHKPALIEALDLAITTCAEHNSLRRVLSDDRARSWLRRLFPAFGSTLLSLANVLAATHRIAHLVIDEAGQCHPAHAVSGLLRADRALLIGDVHQLPPVVQLSNLDEARVLRRVHLDATIELAPFRVGAAFTASAQALADRAVERRVELVDHFRCQPEIIALSDRLCGYRLRVHTPRRSLVDRAPALSSPVLFGAIDGAQQQQHGSWINRAEVDALLSLLDALAGVPHHELAILTPYVAQLELIRRELRPAPELALGTIHRFQGGERSVVILSSVVTEARSLPFLDGQVHLLNVAVSRARDHFVLLGHAPTLSRGRHTRLLLDAAKPLNQGSLTRSAALRPGSTARRATPGTCRTGLR